LYIQLPYEHDHDDPLDVKEHDRLFNITLKHNFKQRNITFIDMLHFSHSRIFNNEKNSYPKISVKRSPSVERYSLLLTINATSGHTI